MDVKVIQDLCISCGLCVSNCPEVFSWDDDEKAHVSSEQVNAELEDCVQDAADGCPTDAIETT
ncbi:MAG: ferredoxin [Firmicutes bacterium]|nr:ferredoxin [Bacillota bacterium]